MTGRVPRRSSASCAIPCAASSVVSQSAVTATSVSPRPWRSASAIMCRFAITSHPRIASLMVVTVQGGADVGRLGAWEIGIRLPGTRCSGGGPRRALPRPRPCPRPSTSSRRGPAPAAALAGVVVGQSRRGRGVGSLIATLREAGRGPLRSLQGALATGHGLHLSGGARASSMAIVRAARPPRRRPACVPRGPRRWGPRCGALLLRAAADLVVRQPPPPRWRRGSRGGAPWPAAPQPPAANSSPPRPPEP